MTAATEKPSCPFGCQCIVLSFLVGNCLIPVVIIPQHSADPISKTSHFPPWTCWLLHLPALQYLYTPTPDVLVQGSKGQSSINKVEGEGEMKGRKRGRVKLRGWYGYNNGRWMLSSSTPTNPHTQHTLILSLLSLLPEERVPGRICHQ